MLKLTAIVSLVLIGSTLWAAGLSCDSCGSECSSACGTRHFRSCCFNYLRRKRGPDVLKFWPQTLPDSKPQDHRGTHPMLVIENVPESWMSVPNLVTGDFKPYPAEDTADNKLQIVYGA